PERAAAQWYARHKVVPINHMVVATEKLSKSSPEAVREVFRMLVESKRAAGLPRPDSIHVLPFGLDACQPALRMMLGSGRQRNLWPRRLGVADLCDDPARWLKPRRLGAPWTRA